MKKISKFILIIILFFTASCGFKVLDKSNKNNFEIIEVNTNGNSRINYRIKSFLLENSQQNSGNIISIEVKTNIIKSVKEKNIKNEITKYEINLVSNINTLLVNSNKKNNINLSVIGDFSVDDNYSATISNEKNLTDNLAEEMAKNILREVEKIINDI